MKSDVSRLRQRVPDVLVATPGRCLDHLTSDESILAVSPTRLLANPHPASPPRARLLTPASSRAHNRHPPTHEVSTRGSSGRAGQRATHAMER